MRGAEEADGPAAPDHPDPQFPSADHASSFPPRPRDCRRPSDSADLARVLVAFAEPSSRSRIVARDNSGRNRCARRTRPLEPALRPAILACIEVVASGPVGARPPGVDARAGTSRRSVTARSLPMREINVAMIGEGFMGRTHSNAWSQVTKFFKPAVRPVMHTSCGRTGGASQGLLEPLGLEPLLHQLGEHGQARARSTWSTSSRRTTCTPRSPRPPSRPASTSPARSRSPARWPRPGRWSRPPRNARVKTFVWYNYRRCPAVALAHKLVKDGAIGTIRHVRAFYLQDWADESIPLVWRFQKEGGRLGLARRPERPHHRHDPVRHRRGDHRDLPAPSPRRSSRSAR